MVATLAFSQPLLELIHRWVTQEEYSHGFLIPLVTVLLLWTRRDAIAGTIGRPSWIGLVPISFALVLHIAGELSAIFILSQIGFVIALMGIALSVGGTALLKLVFIPLAFLLFAIPLPYFIDAALTLRLQLISSELGAFFIGMFGIPVYLDGNIIDLGNYKLQVVEACSGLRYMYPLLSLSFLAAYLFHVAFWKRIVVFLSAVPIAVVMNGLRIGLVGIMVDRWGIQAAEGMLHFFEGWLIFIACAALLAIEMNLLTLRSGKAFFTEFYLPSIVSNPDDKSGRLSRQPSPMVASLMLLGAGAVAIYFVASRSEAIPARTRFTEFPVRLASWQGHPSLLDPETERVLKLDDYILSDYSGPDGAVNLYVAYYSSQRKGESPHSPLVCIPGGGWAISELQRIDYQDRGENLPLNRVVIVKGDSKQLVYYWFEERGRKLASEYWAKFFLFTDAIVSNRTDGALVRLTAPIQPEGAADRRLQSFMHVALPRLNAFLPGGEISPSPTRNIAAAAPLFAIR
jgi:exosortase D (VPLPA-CTERM-specific)